MASNNGSSAPLVVVVTPVYNGAKYLARALDTVQAQDYPNIVHLVLDNASTDDTPAIIAQYSASCDNILTFRNDVLLPLTDNWDKAFSLVPRDARYAKLLCADDLMRNDCIGKFVALSESDPAVETVSCHDVHGNKIRRANIPGGQTVVEGRQATAAILDRSICWLPFQHLFVRLHPEDFEGPFFGTKEYGADPYAVARSALRGKFGYIHEPLVYTRWHDESASNSLARDGKTPLYAMQINLMLMTYFKMLLVFGEKTWNAGDYRRALLFSRGTIARTVLRWKTLGFKMAAHDLETSMEATGHPLTPADYARSILTAPAYVFWKRRWRTEIGPALDERYFLDRHAAA